MSEKNDRYGLFGLLALLGFGVVCVTALASLAFLAYMAWKNSQSQPIVTAQQVKKAIAELEARGY